MFFLYICRYVPAMTASVVLDSLSCLLAGLSEAIVTVKTIIYTGFEVNHHVMSTIIQFTFDFFSASWAFLNFVLVVIYTILACIVDFIAELVNFVAAFLYLVWKLVILLYSFLDLVFRSIECVVYFLWSGGKWTAETLRISGNNLSENGLSTWKYFVLSLKDFTNSVIGGFTGLGELTKHCLILVLNGLCTAHETAWDVIYIVDTWVRDLCNYCLYSLHYFLAEFIPNIPREAYFGLLVTAIMCLILKNIVHIMSTEGFTFPVWYRSRIPADNESDIDIFEQRRRGEFSDDEDYVEFTVTEDYLDDENDDEFSVNSEFSDHSSDSYDDDEDDGELEVDSDSDNESYAASESEMSEINIQLPDLNGPHDLRRSATPSRFTKNMSSDDLQKVIESEKERRSCVVCQDRSKSVLILPCRHMCLCVECGNHIARSRSHERRKCPLCRTRITTIMNVYV